MFYFIIAVVIIYFTIAIHKILKGWWRHRLEDKLLEDTQAITEYERYKIEEEIKRNQE